MYTSEGPGPFSVAMVNRTLEDGECEVTCSEYQLHYIKDRYIKATVYARVRVSSNKC